jgi:pimeloyl-ACP methyl ester carboxylesterase
MNATREPTSRLWLLLGLALLLVFGGGLLAYLVRTDGGSVEVRDVRFMGSNGTLMSALLYVPEGVSAENPAPGIVAIHGYINSRETQDGFSIEFARRGYVVLSLDQTGHGYSDPPAFANGFGGIDGLLYLRTLDIVDPDNIGLEGHSMGGWALLIAAGVIQDGYQSIVIQGSSPGTFGAPEGTPEWPRNLAVVYSQWDEFSALMWGVPVASDVVNTEKMQTLFATNEPVQRGELYGSIEAGTARILYQPRQNHPANHISGTSIGYAVDWFQQTLEGGNDLPPNNQTWFWKELATLIAMIGMVLFIFPFGGLLLQTGFFAPLRRPLPEWKAISGRGWWIAALIMIAIPGLTFFYFQNLAPEWLELPSRMWPQNITTGIMFWAVGNGLITLLLFLIWHLGTNRRAGAAGENYGLGIDLLGRSLLLAFVVFLGTYSLLVLSNFLFRTDFRFWVVAWKLMSTLHLRIFLSYLIPFAFFFVVLGLALHGQMRTVDREGRPSLGRAMLVNVILLIAGIVILLLYQYIPLVAGGTLGNPNEPLLSIVAYQFVPLLAVVALVSTYFFYKTGRIWVGAFLNALLVTWYIVAGQATHFPF